MSGKSIEFRYKKNLGQNFLISEDVTKRIADAVGAGSEDTVLEIGAGAGALTSELSKRAGKVIAVEVDGDIIPILKERLLNAGNTAIINEDILSTDLQELFHREGRLLQGKKPARLFAAGNLPYYITTPILTKLLLCRIPFESITVTVQLEAAKRIVAKPGSSDYGVLSALAQNAGEPFIAEEISKECFRPRPKVTSALTVIKLFKDRPWAEGYAECVKRAFSMRRKTLENALAGYRGKTKEEAADILRALGVDPRRRAETLTTEEFARLAEAFA